MQYLFLKYLFSVPLVNAGKKTREMCEISSVCARNRAHFERFFACNTRYAMKTMRALASNGFHSGSSSSKQCISSRLVHFKGTMRDDITSAVHCSDIIEVRNKSSKNSLKSL